MDNIFGNLVDDSALATSGSGIQFGINKLTIKEMRLENGEFNGNETFQLVFEFDVNGNKNMLFLSLLPSPSLYYNNKLVSKGDIGYDKAAQDFYTQAMGTVVHIYKALGVTEEALAEVIADKKPKDIKSWIKAVSSLVPKNYKEIELDGFFMYQWNIKGNNTRTFLELGPNMKKGHFLSPHIEPVGEWKEITEGNNYYWEDDEWNRHPISKSKSIMKSVCAEMQDTDESGGNKSTFNGDDLPFSSKDNDDDDVFNFD